MPFKRGSQGFEPPPSPLLGDIERRRSTTSFSPESVGPSLRSMSVSPTPPHSRNSHRPKSAKFSSYRLRSNSGLSLHTNEEILKQYTDYHPNGTPRIALYGTGAATWSTDRLQSIDSVTLSQRSSMTITESDAPVDLPIPDIVGRKTFDMVMKDAVARDKLWKFAASQGLGQNIEYLLKIRDYAQSLEQLVTQLAKISMSYTSITATSPISLPMHMSRSLNADIKYLTTTFIPSLEALFVESKAYIEQRVMREIFPAFVKQQMALSVVNPALTDLGRSLDPLEVPRFKGSFCLSDPTKTGNPLVFASDDFEQLSGYSRYEILSRNCRTLQGPQTDREAVGRLRQAIWRREESTELILNFRKDGQPFWNFLYICPLLDAAGKPRYYFGAQVDVSTNINDIDDVLTMFTSGNQGGEVPDDRANESLYKEDNESDIDQDPSYRAQRTKSSKKSFFNPFKKSSIAPLSPPLSPRRSSDRPKTPAAPPPEKTYSTRTVLKGLSTQNNLINIPYSQFMVLESVSTFPATLSNMSLDQELNMTKKYPPRLNISFCSQALLDILDLGMAADAIVQKDVFEVLAEQANSPSITRTFKTSIREAVVADGKTFTIDLALNRRLTKSSSLGRSSNSAEDDILRDRKTGKQEKQKAQLQKMISHWTPLKDADDQVRYVVLLVLPNTTR